MSKSGANKSVALKLDVRISYRLYANVYHLKPSTKKQLDGHVLCHSSLLRVSVIILGSIKVAYAVAKMSRLVCL